MGAYELFTNPLVSCIPLPLALPLSTFFLSLAEAERGQERKEARETDGQTDRQANTKHTTTGGGWDQETNESGN